MATRTLRIAMEGVTGRLGTNQHLIRSVLAIRKEGGLLLRNGDRLIPEPILVGRGARPGPVEGSARSHQTEKFALIGVCRGSQVDAGPGHASTRSSR